MIEVEVKVRLSHDGIETEIDDIGAKFSGSEEQIDVYYGAPHRDFSATDEALRIRTVTSESISKDIITYKGPKIDSESKTREEVEVGIEDKVEMDRMLTLLGFSKVYEVSKTRRNYRIGDIMISLDDVKGLGSFMEVETTSDEAALLSKKEKVFSILNALGYDKVDVIRTSYLELLLENEE
ncbi:MAG: class IV adenylate cyclase [Halobacteriota archaeon]|nr:class IV adenylate cyclase [Halobacteriota archaeon]